MSQILEAGRAFPEKKQPFLSFADFCEVFFFIHHQFRAPTKFLRIWVVCSAVMHVTVSRHFDIC